MYFFNCFFLFLCDKALKIIPLTGENKMLANTNKDAITAITGPVGSFTKLELITVPNILDTPPKRPANITITDNF